MTGGRPHVEGVRHTLALSADPVALAAGIRPSHARNARRAERDGVVISTGTTMAEISDFYALHLRTRRRLGVPVQPVRFFRKIGELLIGRGLGFIATARLAGTPVAAALFLRGPTTLVYKFGASDERAWPHRPNDLLFQRVIEAASADGYRVLDLGRSDKTDEGLRRFKAGWGATEEELVYTAFGRSRWTARDGSRFLSPLIRRSSPLMCRMLGEALYRFSA